MDYNRLIDHTLLAPDARKEQIVKLCHEAKEHHFASVCVNPSWIKLCAQELKGTDVKVCTVIGFPLGATSSESKAFETKQAILDGAQEVDMVIAIGQLKDGDYDYVLNDIKAVREAGADFVKTSTGFSKGGATVHDIALMRKTVGPEMGVKASGGVKTKEDMIALVEAGATRIGTSRGLELIK